MSLIDGLLIAGVAYTAWKVRQMAETLDTLMEKVTTETADIAAVALAVSKLKAGNPDDQAKLDAIGQALTGNNGALEAIAAGDSGTGGAA